MSKLKKLQVTVRPREGEGLSEVTQQVSQMFAFPEILLSQSFCFFHALSPLLLGLYSLCGFYYIEPCEIADIWRTKTAVTDGVFIGPFPSAQWKIAMYAKGGGIKSVNNVFKEWIVSVRVFIWRFRISEHRLHTQIKFRAWVQIPAVPLTSSMTLGTNVKRT